MEVAYSVFWILFSLSDAAITGTPPNANVCDGEFISLKWAYDTANIFAVEWKINGTLMLQYIPSQPINSQYTYSNGYTSAKLTHITNGEINITSLTTSDNGNYSCQTTYTSGNPSVFETQMVLTIYDMVSTNLTCSYNQSVDTIDCSVTIPSSITAVTINGADYPTSTWPISGTNSATYTVCMAGNAANCRNDGIQQCISFEGRSVRTSTLTPTTKQPSDQTCFLRFIDASETWCIIIFLVVMVIIVGVVLLLIYYVLCCRKRNKGNEAEKVLEEKHLNDSNKSEASEKYVAMEEINDGKSSEEYTREGNENQSRYSQDDEESNSFTNESGVNKPKQSNEIIQDESPRNTDM